MNNKKEFFINESIKLANELRKELRLDVPDDTPDEEIIFIVMLYHLSMYKFENEKSST